MNGVGYANLFKTGQHGRLYLVSGRHARGETFRIYVLPKDEQAISNGPNNPPLNKNAIEVYGIIGGTPGWTEEYGWLHKGQWQLDFQELVIEATKQTARKREKEEQHVRQVEEAEKARVQALLADY